jgi:putative membrane protein
MRKTMIFGTVAAVSIALAACNQSTSSNPTPANPPKQTASKEAPGSRNETVSAAKDAVNSAAGQVGAELAASTDSFVAGAAMGDMYEIESSKLAMERSRSKDVKDFAKMMIDAHTKRAADLKSVISKTGITTPIPAALDARHQSLIDDLKGAKREDFDGRYVSQQEGAHNEALILMRGYANSGDNPDMKSFAAKTQGAVQMHIDMLKTLDDAMAGKDKRAENNNKPHG